MRGPEGPGEYRLQVASAAPWGQNKRRETRVLWMGLASPLIYLISIFVVPPLIALFFSD